MSKDWSITDVDKGAQTIESIIFCHKKCKKSKWVVLFQIIPDILHLYLRITDVLFNLLFTDIRYDGVTKVTSPDTLLRVNNVS